MRRRRVPRAVRCRRHRCAEGDGADALSRDLCSILVPCPLSLALGPWPLALGPWPLALVLRERRQRNPSGHNHVQRIDASRNRNSHRNRCGGDCLGREPWSFGAKHQDDSAIWWTIACKIRESRRRPIGRQCNNIHLAERLNRRQPRVNDAEGNTEDRAHRRSDRFSVQRIGAFAVEQHAAATEGRGDSKEAANVIRIADPLQRKDAVRAIHPGTRIALWRTFAKRQAAAVKIETRQFAHRLLFTDEDRRSVCLEHVLRRGERGRRDEHGPHTERARLEQPANDKTAFGDEESALPKPRRVTDMGIVSDTRIVQAGDVDHWSKRG